MNFTAFFRRNVVAMLIATLGMICFAYGLIAFLGKPQLSEGISFTDGQQIATASAEKNSTPLPLVVDVAGGVQHPGVYHLPEESRVQDALQAAGGLSKAANTQLVAKQFNLAMKVTDGMKLYVPLLGDDSPQAASSGQEAGVAVNTAVTKQINLNTASQSELDSLTGVGTVTVHKIVSGRPYTAVDELVTKKIVSQKVFDQIKEQVTTY